MDQKNRREQFIRMLKLGVEKEYNAPNKPESAKNVDRKEVSPKIKVLIDDYCKKNGVPFDVIKDHILKSINESRGVNPRAKDEYDLIEDILNCISNQENEEVK